MPRICKPSIAPIVNRGREYFRISYPTAEGRKREIYSTKKKAQARLREVIDDAHRFGATSDAVTATQRADAAAALGILAGRGTLSEAARFYMADIERREGGKPIAEAVEAFLQSRRDFSCGYLTSLRPRLRFIESFFAGRTTTSIGTDDCQTLIDSLTGTASAKSVRHYRSTMSSLFNFCDARGWCSGNPAKRTTRPKEHAGDIGILSPKDAAKLLSKCPADILPGVVLGVFSGLRQAEIERLDWQAVDLAQGIITVGAGIAKTASRRVCAIPDNARAWLAPYARESGNVWPAKGSRTFSLARTAAGYGPARPWPHNALRHSAISYRLATTPDLAKIAYESGNSPAIIQRHYNGLASPQAAKVFFSILPAEAGNVTRPNFKAA